MKIFVCEKRAAWPPVASPVRGEDLPSGVLLVSEVSLRSVAAVLRTWQGQHWHAVKEGSGPAMGGSGDYATQRGERLG